MKNKINDINEDLDEDLDEDFDEILNEVIFSEYIKLANEMRTMSCVKERIWKKLGQFSEDNTIDKHNELINDIRMEFEVFNSIIRGRKCELKRLWSRKAELDQDYKLTNRKKNRKEIEKEIEIILEKIHEIKELNSIDFNDISNMQAQYNNWKNFNPKE